MARSRQGAPVGSTPGGTATKETSLTKVQDSLMTEDRDFDSDSYDDESSENGSDKGSDDEVQHADVIRSRARSNHAKILSTYAKLRSRRVDLVGDYAGRELFLIEGDSMLLSCFSDEKLDFETGCQLLHATYKVESFLHNLSRRKCNFQIVFFDSNKSLCRPVRANGHDACKYTLARTVIIRHLKANLPDSSAQVHEFVSYTSEDFKRYQKLRSPYFIMTHDGAGSSIRKEQSHDVLRSESDSCSRPQRVAFREMIMVLLGQDLSVALLNGLEWHDTKVMTMVLERGNSSSPGSPTFANDAPQDCKEIDLENLDAIASRATERELLSILTMSSLLKSSSGKEMCDLVVSFLLHEVILANASLCSRRLPAGSHKPAAVQFLRDTAVRSEAILKHVSNLVATRTDVVCDLADFLDGRLFLFVYEHPPNISAPIAKRLDELVTAVEDLCGFEIRTAASEHDGRLETARPPEPPSRRNMSVMPFSNAVFDQHLASIHLDVDDGASVAAVSRSQKIFEEVCHWHNAKKALSQKVAPVPLSEKEKFQANRRNQNFMAEMQKYAASLTNSVGRSLEPQTIIVNSKSTSTNVQPSALTNTSSSTKQNDKKAASGKMAKLNAGKKAILEERAAEQAKKETIAHDNIVKSWRNKCSDLAADLDPLIRYARAEDYLASANELVVPECQLYMANCLLRYWITLCREQRQQEHLDVAARIWSLTHEVFASPHLTQEMSQNGSFVLNRLGLPLSQRHTPVGTLTRQLSFTSAVPSSTNILPVGIPTRDFQLLHCGPYLKRDFDSAPDSRVKFNPDDWQRRVLDSIDANKSVFVVAPTSAGKTFISFYAMQKVLEEDHEGVLVYVAPTKALVNQIAAETQGQFSKSFKHPGKSVWAIHTRDYRINNPTKCQILITVPHILQIMLLAPSNAAWSSRVKRIIFDEIHSIGQAEDGVIWEQLLLIAPCPIIALSATVGNPTEFSDWMASTQRDTGLKVVHHPHRYSDLRKYYYSPPKFGFRGLPDRTQFGVLGLENTLGFDVIHPVAALIDKSRGMPEDLALEPRDCLSLYKAMLNNSTIGYDVPDGLNPANVFPEVLSKANVIAWERDLKKLLVKWMADSDSPFDSVVRDLGDSFHKASRESLFSTRPDATAEADVRRLKAGDCVETTLPMLCRLHEQDALPAILFNYDRQGCEDIGQALLSELEQSEKAFVKSGRKWDKKIQDWEVWKKVEEKSAVQQLKLNKKSDKVSKGGQKDDERSSKLDKERLGADDSHSAWKTFDPNAPAEGFHFTNPKKMQASEVEDFVQQLTRRDIPTWLLGALRRGIGVHHAGMNRKYRQVVEILFRRGFLRVVIATGTLALGINMPCKTVVFSGDNVFLTALNYRQCSGRAGRRGFDLLGNVVFQSISQVKVCRLISSRLPDLNGHFPITTTLVLRLFTLLHESKNTKYAVSAVNTLLSQPRLYMGGPSFKDQTMHHLRFSIEYLRRQSLLGQQGAPLNFAGLVSHLYFTENSAFAFHTLLKEGYFHDLCANIDRNEKEVLETLMLVMAHLFGRKHCRQADTEYREKVVKPSSSIVFLPSMPVSARRILQQHNAEILDIYRTYVETFIDQHVRTADRTLPLTGMAFGKDKNTEDGIISPLTPVRVRSAFVALSGAGDEFDSISDLCQTVREGVFLEQAVVPYVSVYPDDDTSSPLNAWALDFYKHGNVHTIEKANRIRRADIWFMLNDFSLVLATVVASLASFISSKPISEMDMQLDALGDLEVVENDKDNTAIERETASEELETPAFGAYLPTRPKTGAKKSKAKNVESWEDLADEEDAALDSKADPANRGSATPEVHIEEASPPDSDDNDQGLKNVLRAFVKLQTEFNAKFRAMWA